MDSVGTFPASYLNTVNLPLNIFQFIGLDFFDNPKTNVRNRCKLVLFLISFLTFLSCQIFFLVKIDETGASFIDVANAFPFLFLVLINAIKLITLTRKKHLVRYILLEIAELWPSDSEPERKNKIKNKRVRDLNIFRKGILMLTTVSLVMYILSSMFIYIQDDDSPYMYPFQLYYPFKINSLWKYVLVYFMQCVTSSIIHTCLFHATDLFMYTLTYDLCILLQMLDYDLVNLRVERNGPEALHSLNTLKHIVRTHQKLMRLAQTMNDIFGVVMFAVVVLASGMLSFFGFLAIVAREKYQMFLNVATLAHAGFVVFYVTLPGQILDNTSSEFANAAYECLWYDGDTEFRRIIYIIIARSQKSCKLRAMGYTDMNFGTYCKICSTAWSYLSVLHQMYQNVEFEF